MAEHPQAVIMDWADFAHVAFGYSSAFSPIQKNRLDQGVVQAYCWDLRLNVVAIKIN